MTAGAAQTALLELSPLIPVSTAAFSNWNTNVAVSSAALTDQTGLLL
jgi:hypothetical protein